MSADGKLLQRVQMRWTPAELAFARIKLPEGARTLTLKTRGKVELRRERVDLRQVLEHVLTAFRPRADLRRLTLHTPQGDTALWVYADSTRLEQVFTNLLDNAAKYTDEGGSLWLSTRELPGAQGQPGVRVSVRDSGIGIPADVLPLVFELFSQADESLERSRGGLGIGLTLVRNMVDLHDGQVEAHSAGPGHGSEFTVWLPLLPPLSTGPEPEPAAAAALLVDPEHLFL